MTRKLNIPKRTVRVGSTRNINGKRYKYVTAFMNKTDAKEKAKKIRSSGKLARTMPIKPLGVRVFSVWKGPKSKKPRKRKRKRR